MSSDSCGSMQISVRYGAVQCGPRSRSSEPTVRLSQVLNVHSGLSHGDIVEWVEKYAASCPMDDGPPYVMLLDEINASHCVGKVVWALRPGASDSKFMLCTIHEGMVGP